MKTILLVSPYWKESHRWMVSSVKLAELWQRMGYRVVVVCMGTCRMTYSKEIVSDMLTIYRVWDFFLPDPLNYGIAPTFLLHVLRVLKSEKPNIVVVNKVLFWSSLVTPILRLMGHRPIVTTDALVGMTWWPRSLVPKFIMAIGAWTAGWIVLLSAWKVVFFHPQPEALLKWLGVERKSRVIPTGLDTARFPASTEVTAGQQVSDIRFQDAHMTITYIGRLESVKGVDDFLAAAVPLKTEFPKMKIQVVGWYKKNHPIVSRYASDIHFLGLRNDISAILSVTDIFVLPSYSEGLSNALMEAMASGCACIASAVGGNKYLIENGTSGLLFPAGDRNALRSHIRRLIEDSAAREAMGRLARKRIEEHFDWSHVEKEYARLFSTLLE